MKDFDYLFEIRRVPSKEAKDFIRANHYSRSCHNGPSPCYGLFERGGDMVGCLAFATPCSENVRAWPLGPAEVNSVVELHRLFIHDVTPKNIESYFVSACLKVLPVDRPGTKVVVSFSDRTEGHEGKIYAACNFVRTGETGRATFYRDGACALRHPRQNGVNISKEVAADRGWTPETRESKTRWHIAVGKKSQRRKITRILKEKAQ